MDVSVVICTYNRAALLGPALEALRGQRVRSSLAWEIVVVDNNSRDATKTVVEKFQRSISIPVSYTFEPVQGLCRARNTGVVVARGDIVAFTDDDVTPECNWVENVAAAIASWNADGVGGRVLPKWLSPPPRWLAEEPHLRSSLSILESEEVRRVEIGAREAVGIAGANMAFRRELFEKIGAFSTGLDRRGEKLYGGGDLEFIHRAVAAGYVVVFDPTLVVGHCIGGDRMVRRYFRKLRFDGAELRAVNRGLPGGRHVMGIPPYLFGRIGSHVARWIMAAARRDSEAFCKELDIVEDIGLMVGWIGEAIRSGKYASLGRGAEERGRWA